MIDGPQSGPLLRMRFLGRCEVLGPEGPVHLETAKTQALLVYLVCNPGPQSRHTLMGLLWAELPESNARRNLRRALWNLRRELTLDGHAPIIVADRETIAYDPESRCDADVTTFDVACTALWQTSPPPAPQQREVSARQAAALYQGDFLEGFFVSDAAGFEEWALAERERLRTAALRVLRFQVTTFAAQERVREAVAAARRLVALEPWLEEGHVWLMRLLMREGRRAQALAQYEVCKATLAEALGVAPSKATRALYEEIQAETFRHVSSELPAATTPFVGRQRELSEIAALLDTAECRLVTLTGLGGIGKTRLAREVAAQLTGAFDHGMAYVDLSAQVPAIQPPPTDGGLPTEEGKAQAAAHVIAALARALQIPLLGAADPEPLLHSALRERRMLLVLDNFEPFLAGAGCLTDILHAAPGIKMLVTSRERLRLRGEWAYQLTGLDCGADQAGIQEGSASEPHPEPGAPQREAAQEEMAPQGLVLISDPEANLSDAGKLFVQTARRTHLGFQLRSRDHQHLARICHLVAGHPLALELAAAWVRVLPLAQIAAGIARGDDFLATTERDRPERHGSIQAVIEQAWDMLSESERQICRQLAVFPGSFRPTEATAAAGCSRQQLTALLDRSLLQPAPHGRLKFHGLVLQYAYEQLAALPEAVDAARERHGRVYAARFQRYNEAIRGKRPMEEATLIGEELENVRAAWAWAVAQRDIEAIAALNAGLADCLHLMTAFQEGAALFDDALTHLGWAERDACTGAPACELRTQRATFLIYLGQLDRAQADLLHCLAVFEELDETEEIAHCRFYLGEIARFLGRTEIARARYSESLQGYRQTGNQSAVGFCLNGLGTVSAGMGAAPEARLYFEECLGIFRSLDHTMGEAIATINLADLLIGMQAYTAAAERLDRGRRLCRKIGHRWGMATCRLHAGDIARLTGRPEEARAAYREALDILESIGQQQAAARCKIKLGQTYAALGAGALADEYLRAAMATAEALHDPTLYEEAAAALAKLTSR